MIGYVVPTRDRPAELARTLAALGRLPWTRDGDEVVVVDNASAEPARAPGELNNGLPVRVIRWPTNAGAAGRNAAAQLTDAAWLVMLDDDSAPVGGEGEPLAEILERQPPDVLAVSADIRLPASGGTGPRRESGGLPEVIVGCGAAVRREAFLSVGGYDPAFGYYVEEYDLCARLLLAGGRVAFEPGFVVLHRKSAAGRDMDLILRRLVRNNGWVAARYAPEGEAQRELAEIETRCRAIAEKEGAVRGYEAGLAELRATIESQQRTPMPAEIWDRFTGLAAAREAIAAAQAERPFWTASIVAPGKNAWAVRLALAEIGVCLQEGLPGRGEALVIGTLSPGPMLDAAELLGATARRVIAPWLVGGTGPGSRSSGRELAYCV